MSLPNTTDGALTILLVETGLVILGGAATTVYLVLLVGRVQAAAATVRPVGECRKFIADFLTPTAPTKHQATMKALVFDPMKAHPDQVGTHSAKRDTSPSGNLPDRESAAEQVSNLVHKRYLKRKQQRSLVAF
jgi:hypothetical protein